MTHPDNSKPESRPDADDAPGGESDAKSASSLASLSRLMDTLLHRAQTRPPGSYTTRLLEGGVEKIGGKIREEADELIEAAGETGDEGRQHFVYEAGDLIYHTMVLLAHRGVAISEVAAELARREGTSGLAEKASRKTSSVPTTSVSPPCRGDNPSGKTDDHA